MVTCSKHQGQKASLQCRLCNAKSCHRCGQAGDACPSCHQGLLRPIATRTPSSESAHRSCVNHPGVHARLKLCASCERWFCGDCIAFGGICTSCNEEHVAALKPMNKASGFRPPGPKARRMPSRMILGRVIGGLKNLVLLGAGGALLWTGWRTIQASPLKLQASRPAIDTRLPGSGAAGALDALAQLQALQKKGLSGRPSGPDTTDDLMRQSGLDVAGAGDGQTEPVRISEDETRAALEALVQRERPSLPDARPAVQTGSIRLGFEGLRRGQKVRGMFPIRVFLTGNTTALNVELQVNGSWIGMANHPPYQFEWDTSTFAPGRYKLQAIATEPGGGTHASPPLWVTVTP